VVPGAALGAHAVAPGCKAMLTMPKARRYQRKLLARIQRTASLPPSPERDTMLEVERERYVRSGGVKAARLRTMKRLRRLPDSKICRLANSMNILTPCAAPVRWHHRQKRSGGWRQICDLPTKARLGQLIARDLVVAQISPPEQLYNWPGRGIHRYVEAVRDALSDAGPFIVTMDVANCYSSVNVGAVYALNLLPDELARSCIDSRYLRYRYVSDGQSPSHHCSTTADPCGLLQGGPASPVLVVALIGDIFAGLPADSRPRGYADEFAVFGHDQSSAESAAGELARHLAGSRMGPLHVRSVTQDLRDGCGHVGCQFLSIGGEVECWIPDHRLTAVIERMKERIRAASSEERARGADHFARVAMGPYRWAARWQHDHVFEEADEALEQARSDRDEERLAS
jgi:hypothetical protein